MHKSATLVTKLCRDLAPILGDKTHRIISENLFFKKNSWLCEFVRNPQRRWTLENFWCLFLEHANGLWGLQKWTDKIAFDKFLWLCQLWIITYDDIRWLLQHIRNLILATVEHWNSKSKFNTQGAIESAVPTKTCISIKRFAVMIIRYEVEGNRKRFREIEEQKL